MIADDPTDAAASDSYGAVKQLHALGMDEPQARAIVKIVSSSNESRTGDLATKVDIAGVEMKIEQLKTHLTEMMKNAETSANRWTAGSIFTATGTIIAAVKLL